MRAFISLFTSVLILSAVPAFPQIYTWTDASGTTNFSDNPGTIPAKYRKKAVLVGGDDTKSQESSSAENIKAGTYNIISRPVEDPKNVPTLAKHNNHDANARQQKPPSENPTGGDKEVKTSLDVLADTLMQGASNDREKAYAIFEWIVKNIYYDRPELYKRRSGQGTESQAAQAVLESKHAVCAGFANLFTALAGKMGLKSAKVTGIAAGSRQEAHAWNAVMIDGKWGLVDTVYRHFLSPPEEFIYKHFPFDPQWQLLAKPVTKAEWLKK